MKITQDTIDVLKNFSSINSSIIIENGSNLKTVSPTKTLMGYANVVEEFPMKVCIYDLNVFLGTLTLFEEPKIDFSEKFMEISEGKAKSKTMKVKYFYAAENVMTAAKCKDITMPESFIQFKFDEADYDKLVKASGTLELEDFVVESDGEHITLSVFNKKDSKGCNRFSIDVGAGNGDKYQMIIKVKNLKMIRGTYDVEISDKSISQFKHISKDLKYFIAVDAASKKY